MKGKKLEWLLTICSHHFTLSVSPQDILSNLDPLESCDLEDDDLMLDVDLSEDAPLCSGEDAWESTLNVTDPRSGEAVDLAGTAW